ncbi:hypothetical protein DH2020_004568 [Rehmannia glutinosa]|uniref:Reverse transcriptase Ty1/copia-type domain-containing protein n=1 Tax=Rehmannia glutinosa TaxID=99300 RepID=A0ABR0XPV3_REHGL
MIHQMDVKTAFLIGDLDEEIYMEQPEGFKVKGQEHKVCKLVKSLYGLKQAPKQWHEKFNDVIQGYGFRSNEHDKCIYFKEENGGYVILCLYVDDILIFGSNLEFIEKVKVYLSNNFEMKDLGEAHIILGMKVRMTKEGIVLNQSDSIEKFLRKFNYYDCKSVSTPYDPNVHLHKNLGEPISQLKYSQIIGSLLYFTNMTRPDIFYAVGRLSRYTHNPSKSHWTTLERVLKYLRGTLSYSLCYKGFPSVLEGYSDANWITDNSEIKSTSGFVFMFGGAAITWGSKKQTIISRSTMEAEIIALDTTCTTAEWLRDLLLELRFCDIGPMELVCDNQSALHLSSNPVFHSRTKHIDVRYHFIRDHDEKKDITLENISTDKQLADIFTKPLRESRFEELKNELGLIELS